MKISVSKWIPFAETLVILLAFCASVSASTYTLTVLFSTSTNQAQLQKDFLAATTTQYQATITPTAWGTTNVMINGKTGVQGPAPITTSTAFDECIAYGFANGLDYERGSDLKILNTDESVNSSSGTCSSAYSQLRQDISDRWGKVYFATDTITLP